MIFYEFLMGKKFVRFLFAGICNTIFTYGVYMLLLYVIPYFAAYTVAFIAGIFISYIVNHFYVFKVAPTKRVLIRFPLIYLIQYFIGSSIMWLLVQQFNINKYSAIIVTMAISFSLTYLLMNYLLNTKTIPLKLKKK